MTHQKDLPRYQPENPLHFVPSANPEVSILIPVYNNIEYTLNCLNSIALVTSTTSYEIIIIDDCSSDATSEIIATIEGVIYLRNDKNLGFIQSCNAGADVAKGKYIVFLNNDTIVTSGWVDALVETFKEHKDVGLVGAKLVYPNGTLQEAGGVIWKDGSGWNYGIQDNPDDPKYNYLRECDYCSGACLMVERLFFNAIGRFDLHYLPAYYEDTDLAFKTREHHKKVYYQPKSLIYHFEGMTSGNDLSKGVKHHQMVNQKKFYARWQHVLKNHRPNGVDPEMEKERDKVLRILIIDAHMVTPDMDSGSLRMFNLIKILLTLNCKVTFLAEDLWYLEKYVQKLQSMGVEVLYAPFVKSVDAHLKDCGRHYDVIILSRADVADNHIDAAKAHARKDARIIFDTVDLHFLREQRQAELENAPGLKKRAMWRKDQELTLMKKAHATFVVSPLEKEMLSAIDSSLNLHVLSNIHETGACNNAFSQRQGLLFIGAFDHAPNGDAVTYFIRSIFPRIISRLKGVKLFVIGSNPNKRIWQLASDNVEVVGYAEDLKPYLDNCRVAVAPLRYGAGVKGKINTYLNAGLPVVATSLAVEGMYLKDEINALITDDPEAFAEQVIRLYSDEQLWLKLSDAGLKNMAAHFSFEAARTTLLEVFQLKPPI
jgi:GT2 family glycosyltransferase